MFSTALALLIEIKRAAVGLWRKLRRLAFDRRFRDEYLQQRWLLAAPRGQPGRSDILGPRITFADPLSFLSAYDEVFVDEVYRFAARRPDPFILDCGANIGLSVAYFKRLYPEARIVAFEADQKVFQLLSANVQALQLTHVTLECKAVWTAEGTQRFWRQGGLSGRLEATGDVEVETIRLRDRLDAPIDLLKIDIEGAEVDVLRDCADRLSRVSSIVLEYHAHESRPQQLHELLAILQAAGFRYHIKESWVAPAPLVRRESMLGMDLQLNVYAFRDAS